MDAGEDSEASLLQKKTSQDSFWLILCPNKQEPRVHCNPYRVVHFSILGAERKEQSGEGPREVRAL